MLSDIIDKCRYLLYNYSGANDCLSYIDSRITRETQAEFKFGYFPKYNEIHLLADVADLSNLTALNLTYQKVIEDSICRRYVNFTFFDNHQMIMPYNDCYDNTIAVVGRSLLNDKERKELQISKYKNTIFQKQHHLFCLNKAKKNIFSENKVYIVEGQFDAIKAYEAGLKNVVAVGNANLSEYQLSLLLRYTNNITICFDNDDAGNNGADKALLKYSKYCNISKISLPFGYKDVDEFFSQNSLLDFISLFSH